MHATLRPALVAAALAGTLACGSSAEPPSTAASAGGEGRPLPELPTDPLAIVPKGAQLVLTADVAAARSSPHYATVKRWAARQTCSAEGSDHWLLDRAERVVLAGYEQPGSESDLDSLVLVRAPAQPGDTVRLLNEQRAVLGRPSLNLAEQPRGRHVYVEADGTAAAKLGDHILVVGETTLVQAVLATADGEKPAFPSGDERAAALHQAGWLTQHTLALTGRISERGARRMARALSRVGAANAAAPIERGTLALSVDLDSALRAAAQVELADVQAATAAAEEVRTLFGRLDLLLRLIGLPAALAHPDVRAEGARLSLQLALTAEDVRAVLERLDAVVGSSTPPCAVQARSDSPAGRGGA